MDPLTMADPPLPDSLARTEAAPLPAAPAAPAASGAPAASTASTGPDARDARAEQLTLSGPADDSPPLVAGRYEVLGMLGSGGMGTVYRARDRELDEVVALKLLRKELAHSPGMLERFRREVKLARRVTHKNVARTFDIGEFEGDRFLTMELIEGEMLGAHLARRGRLPLRDVIAIGCDVCAGLAAAHDAGVLHRDLKPENVIIARDGRAVITDFGIARAAAQGELGRTGGGIVGTPTYMAPEQVEGAQDIDGRVDLYALGAMLYELLAGKPAWGGDSVIAVAAGRLLRPPPDVRVAAPKVPASAAELVLKLMARLPADRYASAAEAGEALAALASSGVPPDPSARSLLPPDLGVVPAPGRARKTVAVLPLLNLGPADDQYLAESVAEDLVDLLSVVPELRLRPRGDTLRFDQPSRDVREAGRTMNVDVVVDGSVRRAGDAVRVSVRLVTVEDGFQLWAKRFDRPAAVVLTVADDVAAAIAAALATEVKAEARPVVGDAVAQDLYLRGRFLMHRGWFDRSQSGVELLRQAYERAPSDLRIAGAYALAMARVRMGNENASAVGTEARELAEKVLLAEPDQMTARLALGFVHLNNSEGAAAASQMKRALAASPDGIDALDIIGRVLVEVDRWRLGFETLQRALAVDPMLMHSRYTIARGHALLGDFDRAREMVGPWSKNVSDFQAQMLLRSRMALWSKNTDDAAELLKLLETREVAGDAKASLVSSLTIAMTRSLHGDPAKRLDKNLPAEGRFPPRRLSFHAQIRAENKLASGDVEGGLIDLRFADNNGLLDLMWLTRCPVFDVVRGHPEYQSIVRSTTARAARVIEILEPHAIPYGA